MDIFKKKKIHLVHGDKLNNELSNLEIVIPQENKARAYRTGLRKDNDPTTLINSETGEEHMFYSQTETARFLNSSSGSISYQIQMKLIKVFISVVENKNSSRHLLQ